MNNKGQAFIFFIILIPIIILALGFIVELSIISYEKKRVYSISKTIILSTLEEKNKDDIIKLYDDNDIKYDNLEISFSDGVRINITVKINSFLGKLINKDYYLLKLDLTGYKDNGKVKFKKG